MVKEDLIFQNDNSLLNMENQLFIKWSDFRMWDGFFFIYLKKSFDLFCYTVCDRLVLRICLS